MGDNATEGMYMAVYIFIFIVAVSATITMFYMINNYAELSYEYGNTVSNGALIENVPTTSYRIVTGNQLIGYYYHYIAENTDGIYNYIITVKDDAGNDIKFSNEKGERLGYSEVLKIADPTAKYSLKYVEVKDMENGSQNIYITIKELTQEEIDNDNV